MATVEDRLAEIERMIKDLVYIQMKNEMEFHRFKEEMSMVIQRMEADTQKLKEEMRQFKDEMRQFKDEMKQFKDEMKQFKDEMKQFKDEMRQFKENIEKEHKRMNKQWGELANKMGTIVEDIVYPATKPVLEKYFKCEITEIGMNIKKKKDGYKDEFDVIAVSEPCKSVYLIEVKSTVRESHIDNFTNKIESLKRLFPEYKDYKIIPILASLRFDEDKLNYATKHNIYAMAYREWEYMDLLNFDKLNN